MVYMLNENHLKHGLLTRTTFASVCAHSAIAYENRWNYTKAMLQLVSTMLLALAVGCSSSLTHSKHRYPVPESRIHQSAFIEAIAHSQKDIVVAEAPDSLIQGLQQDTQTSGITFKPKKLLKSASAVANVKRAYKKIPLNVLNLLRGKLYAIFVTAGLDRLAYANEVYNQEGEMTGGYIVLDYERLNFNAQSWASGQLKLITPALKDSITAEFATKKEDHPSLVFRFVLTEAMGQLIALLDPEVFQQFYIFSWRKGADGIDENIQEPALGFRSRPFLFNANEIVKVFDRLSSTNLPTLTASRGPYSDFAESLAMYLHTQVYHQPFAWHYRDQSMHNYQNCMTANRCAEKIAYFSNQLAAHTSKK